MRARDGPRKVQPWTLIADVNAGGGADESPARVAGGHNAEMSEATGTNTTTTPRVKITAGAALLCVAVVGAQFSTKDVVSAWASYAIGSGVPLIATLGVVLVTSPPRGRRRAVLAVVAALAAMVTMAILMLPLDRFPRLETAAHVTMFICTPLAGIATYLHLARQLRAARRPMVAALAMFPACLLIVAPMMCAAQYGFDRGVVGNVWYYTAPGVGERLAPAAFVIDWLVRPAVEWEQFRTDRLGAAYTLVTVATPLLVIALMLWLIAHGGDFSPHRRPPGP